MTLTRRLFAMAATAVAAVSGLTALGTVAATEASAQTMRPVIFLHGGFGSGTQFQTQAKRFASNGYPPTWLESHDYDSTFLNNTRDQVFAALDARIARLKSETGADKVELMGHSLGTAMSQAYLTSSAARAANVAHYVNIDGAGATALPGGVPTLMINAGNNTSTMPGATILRLQNQTHVQATSSVESFVGMYRHFRGAEPATTRVEPQAGTIQLRGRAVSFPSNVGVQNGTLNVYTVNPATGQRTGAPVYTTTLSGEGNWGPFVAGGTESYEFAVTKNGVTHHFYQSPFRRSDMNVRLLSTDPGTGIDLLLERDARHVTMLNYRDKEWWGDQTGDNLDTLTINGQSVLNANTAPRSRLTIGLFAYDQFKNQQSNVNSVPGLLGFLPFMSGTDYYIPASPTASGVVTLRTTQRNSGGATETINFPNWPSNVNVVTVRFEDFA
jgi:pimeloyl-ACP methyl ester carboxylesterase